MKRKEVETGTQSVTETFSSKQQLVFRKKRKKKVPLPDSWSECVAGLESKGKRWFE